MSHNLDTSFPSRQIYINSRDCEALGSIDRIRLVLKDQINVNDNVDILISLVDFQCPVSFYNIRSVNNQFTYTINAIQSTFTVPVRNYNATELANVINANTPITLNYNTSTAHYTFTASQEFTINATSTILNELGLTIDTDHQSISETLESDQVVDLSGISSIYIHTNLHTHNLDSRVKGLNKVFGKVSIMSSFGGFINYVNTTQFKTHVFERNIGIIEIYLRDEYDRPIELNNTHYTLTLQVDFMYNKPYISPWNGNFNNNNIISTDSTIKNTNGLV